MSIKLGSKASNSIAIDIKAPAGFSLSGDSSIEVTEEKVSEVYSEARMVQIMAMAREQWGFESRMRKAQEECGELIVAISHFLSARKKCSREELASEIADVTLMCKQLTMDIGKELVDKEIQKKMERVHGLLMKNKNPND